MGPLSYYLGYNFVVGYRVTSRGLVATEELLGDIRLPSRYPGELTWNEEIRLMFPHFLAVNSRTRDLQRRVVPTTTLMSASRHSPFLFMSLVLQRSHDDYMHWPNLTELGRTLDDMTGEIRGDPVHWRICNMTKLPPLKAQYPVSSERVEAIRSKVRGLGLGGPPSSELNDVVPDLLTHEERDILTACRDIDAQFLADKLAFMRHC